MINADSRLTVRNGRVSVVPETINTAGVMNKQSPDPVWHLPSSSSIIPHTSVLSNMEVDRTSLAFVAKTYHANLTPINNFNANGRLNA